MGKFKRKAGKKLSQRELVQQLQMLFEESPTQVFSMKDIYRILKFNTHPQKMLTIDILDEMAVDGYLERAGYNRFRLGAVGIEYVRKKQEARNRKHYGVVGEKKDDDTVMHEILEEYGLPYTYPRNAEKAAEEIEAKITPQDIAEREDFRHVTTFTIDPYDAKDFDDALSIRPLEGGLWEVGVHIADVSHYIKEDSALDIEARKRGTSVYLVDRTIPMLPERLCNFICSLRPDEEKLCYSVIFNLNEDAEVKSWRLVHTIIKSNRRYAYEEVQEILEGKDGDYANELRTLDQLAKKMREARFENGAIDFNSEELHFDVDENGKPIAVHFKVQKDANKLIEEFMLLANRTVAESIGKVKRGQKKKTLPYRIHDNPDLEKLENLSQFIRKFGYKLKTTGSKEKIARSLNGLMDECNGKGEQRLIQMVALRAMMKAKYSVHNIGHFGLAFDYYTHFTSPIRRYPDVMVHRLLTLYQNGGKSADANYYEDLCEYCSEREVIATQAERASIQYKQVEFLADKIGEEFDAHITSITEWGVYCEIDENHCEGMVPLREFDDDYYEFDEKNYCLRGRRYHRIYSLGDPIKIIMQKANFERRQISFALV
ncbi:MAG: ribonuclease R [Prevotellaceae bacterium]|nr:ribonuclease R [Prevotellaceae bacterium]